MTINKKERRGEEETGREGRRRKGRGRIPSYGEEERTIEHAVAFGTILALINKRGYHTYVTILIHIFR